VSTLRGESSLDVSFSALRAELEHLEEQRLKLAQERAEAWRIRDLPATDKMTDELARIYERYRKVRAGVAAGKPGPISTTRDAITAIPEIVADPVRVFVRQRCQLRADAMTPTREIVAAYLHWAAAEGAEPASPHHITKQLGSLFSVATHRSHGVRLYRGITLGNTNPQAEGDTFGRRPEPVRILGA
jgi:hypothetical protein